MWTISELTELVGLSRRDIQRLCYADERNGGLGLLDPEDSAQGRRHFSREDVEVLFVVSQYKALGMSLPEAAGRVRQAREEGADARALASDLVRRLEEEREDVERRLAVAKAIEGSAVEGGWNKLFDAVVARLFMERTESAVKGSLADFCLSSGLSENEVSELMGACDEAFGGIYGNGAIAAQKKGIKLAGREAAQRLSGLSSVDWRDKRTVRGMVRAAFEACVEELIKDDGPAGPHEESLIGVVLADPFRRLLSQKDLCLLLDMEYGAGCSAACLDAVVSYGRHCIEALEEESESEEGDDGSGE